VLWEIDEHAWLFIEPNPGLAGTGRITLAVAGLDALLERSLPSASGPGVLGPPGAQRCGACVG
jgi:hypothetical protein